MSSRRARFVLGKGPTLIESVAPGVFDAASLCGLYAALTPWPAVESAIHSKHLKMHNFVSPIQARLWPTPEPLPVAQ
jgi:phosphoribosylcarboxyaminoimidazole (NCAIR) mutase